MSKHGQLIFNMLEMLNDNEFDTDYDDVIELLQNRRQEYNDKKERDWKPTKELPSAASVSPRLAVEDYLDRDKVRKSSSLNDFSKLCRQGDHYWCMNRNAEESNCKCSCHVGKTVNPENVFVDDTRKRFTNAFEHDARKTVTKLFKPVRPSKSNLKKCPVHSDPGTSHVFAKCTCFTTPKKVTRKDVARAAGVSLTTVNRVFNENDDSVATKTYFRVKKCASDMGYEPLEKKPVTIEDVARETRFSLDVVRSVLNGEMGWSRGTCKAVADAANRLGYKYGPGKK